MISRFYNLGEDEIDNAINSLNNMILIKRIEKSNGCIPYLKGLYRNGCIPTRRDFDYEGYNGLEESPLGILMLDAIFTEDCYQIDDVISDIEEEQSTMEELEYVYYDFRIKEEFRLNHEEIEDIGVRPKLLTLSSNNIDKALKIAEIAKFKYRNNIFINEIQILANSCLFGINDIEEASLIDLHSYKIHLLLSEISIYEIELAAVNLFDLEEYCKDLVGRYGQWID